MHYFIEHQIQTLAHNAVMDNKSSPASFTVDGITFSHGNFSFHDGWLENYWMAKEEVEASSGLEAINAFRKKLDRIIPRVALIGQSYVDFVSQPWLVTKQESGIFLYRHSREREGGGLMFMEKEKEALEVLVTNTDVPNEFFFYWNEAVNSTGYPAKLLLMFSALESLVKTPQGKKDWTKLTTLLGQELTVDLFGTKENSATGLRHRLVHGEYFSQGDHSKNYLDAVHKKVLAYFNREIFKKDLLELGVVQPQRHFFGNREGGIFFFRSKGEYVPDLRDLLQRIGDNYMIDDTDQYEAVHEKVIREAF